MAALDEFGIIPFERGLDGRMLVRKEIRYPSEEDAQRAGEVFANVLGGAVAFRRVSDRAAGIVGQGVIIGRYGVLAGTDSLGSSLGRPMAPARHGEMSARSDTVKKFLLKVSASMACALAGMSVFDLVIFFTRNIAFALMAGLVALSAAVWFWRYARRWRPATFDRARPAT
jgi:hypothetical protein